MLNELSDALVGSAACFVLQVLVCSCLEAALGEKKRTAGFHFQENLNNTNLIGGIKS